MERNSDYDECLKCINTLRKQRAITNCFLMSNQIKALVELHKLYILEVDSNFYLFEKEDDFYRVYYFICDVGHIEPLKAELPMVIEFPYKASLADKQLEEISLIERLGFSLARKSARMSMKASDVQICKMPFQDKIYIEYAKADEADFISSFLKDTFNKMFAFLPTNDQVKKLISSENILVCYYEGKPAGIVNMEIVNNIAWIRHIAVVDVYRGIGLGRIMLNSYQSRLKDKVNEFMHWVDLSNKSAISMYKKAGYEFDGRIADEYVNEKI